MGLIADSLGNGRMAFARREDFAAAWWEKQQHKIGVIAPADEKDLSVWCREAGVDFRTLTTPVYVKNSDGTFTSVPEFVANRRTDNGAVLGVMTPQWKDHHFPDMLATFQEAINSAGARMATVLAYKGGRILCASAELSKDYSMQIGNDHIDSVLGFSTRKDGQGASQIDVTQTVRVCQNTDMAANYSAQKSGKLIRVTHKLAWLGADIRQMLETLQGSLAGRAAIINNLLNERMTEDEVRRFFAQDVLGFDEKDPSVSTRMRNMLESIMLSYKTAPGAVERFGTAWGAYNAVTHWTDHVASTRDTCDDGTMLARMYSSKFGKGATVKTEALRKICERSKIALAA